MPITKELDNIRKFESVGFSHEQAEILTDVIEQSHVDGQQGLKEFIHNEISSLELRMKNEITNLELRMKASQTDLLIKIFGIVAGCTSVGIAVSKLLG